MKGKSRKEKGERRNQNFAIKREQNKFIYYAEREQSQDRKAGLKEKSTPSASLVPPVSGGQSAGAVLALGIVRSLWIPRASAALIPAQASHSKEKNL